jgi:hypothetical protein
VAGGQNELLGVEVRCWRVETRSWGGNCGWGQSAWLNVETRCWGSAGVNYSKNKHKNMKK